MREIRTSGLMSGIWKRDSVTAPDLDSTRRGGKDAGYAANGTLAFRAVAGFESKSALAAELRSDVRRTWVRLGKRDRRDRFGARRGERLVSQIGRPNTLLSGVT
jgi:hypothetical protein